MKRDSSQIFYLTMYRYVHVPNSKRILSLNLFQSNNDYRIEKTILSRCTTGTEKFLITSYKILILIRVFVAYFSVPLPYHATVSSPWRAVLSLYPSRNIESERCSWSSRYSNFQG